jgi:hypothetical protein
MYREGPVWGQGPMLGGTRMGPGKKLILLKGKKKKKLFIRMLCFVILNKSYPRYRVKKFQNKICERSRHLKNHTFWNFGHPLFRDLV